MSIFGHRCVFCGLYIRLWQRVKHERWHADCTIETLKLLCNPCAKDHGKMHQVCGKFPDCRCICNAGV